jgi:hypothetical protein
MNCISCEWGKAKKKCRESQQALRKLFSLFFLFLFCFGWSVYSTVSWVGQTGRRTEQTEQTAGRCRALGHGWIHLSLGRIRNRDKLTSLPGAITLLVVFDLRCRPEGASASGGAGVERSRVPSAGTFFSSLMLVMIDSFVERSPSGPDRSCLSGVRVGKVRKKTGERVGSDEGVEARVSYHFAGRRVSQFANESLTGYLGISRDASNDISA